MKMSIDPKIPTAAAAFLSLLTVALLISGNVVSIFGFGIKQNFWDLVSVDAPARLQAATYLLVPATLFPFIAFVCHLVNLLKGPGSVNPKAPVALSAIGTFCSLVSFACGYDYFNDTLGPNASQVLGDALPLIVSGFVFGGFATAAGVVVIVGGKDRAGYTSA